MKPSLSELLVKSAVTHTVTYFLAGLMFFWTFDYAHLYAETGFRFLMRQTNDPVILVGPLVQPIRGALFGFVFYLLREPLFGTSRGWLLMWALLVIVGIIGTFGPAPGSIEGMIYTILPVRLQLIGMPEVLLQSLALSAILFSWVRSPQRRWLSWVMGVTFVGIVLMMTMAIISSR